MITVYILRVDGLDMSLADLLPFGDAERIRISAIKNSKHKSESLGGTVALWRLLERAGGSLPLELRRTEGGKPYFADGDRLPFGISHSNGIAAAALGDSECGDIGFDLEVIDEKTDRSGIADRFFSELEMKEYEQGGRTAEAFYSVWTAKEAFAKLDGRGLALSLGKDEERTKNTALYRRIAYAGGVRVALAIACRSEHQTIKIFTDREDTS